MPNKFLVSVSDVYVFDKCDAGYTNPWNSGTSVLTYSGALFTAKTMTDSTINTTISNADTRGGFGNPLLNVFYHTAEMSMDFTDAKFNLMAIKSLVGDDDYDETTSGNNVITISAAYIPKSLEVFLTAKLAGTQTSGCNGIIGSILVHIPLAQLDGAVAISLTADGVSNTPFKARALASGTTPIYAQIHEFGTYTDSGTAITFADRD